MSTFLYHLHPFVHLRVKLLFLDLLAPSELLSICQLAGMSVLTVVKLITPTNERRAFGGHGILGI